MQINSLILLDFSWRAEFYSFVYIFSEGILSRIQSINQISAMVVLRGLFFSGGIFFFRILEVSVFFCIFSEEDSR